MAGMEHAALGQIEQRRTVRCHIFQQRVQFRFPVAIDDRIDRQRQVVLKLLVRANLVVHPGDRDAAHVVGVQVELGVDRDNPTMAYLTADPDRGMRKSYIVIAFSQADSSPAAWLYSAMAIAPNTSVYRLSTSERTPTVAGEPEVHLAVVL